MTERPDDIPAAMREAFSGHRTSAAWNLVVSAEPNMRLAALLGFERLLSSKGLGLADVATAIAALPAPAPAPGRRDGRDPDDPSIDWSVFGGAAAPHATATRPSSPKKTILKGPAVPETVIGRIRIEEQRPMRSSGSMLVFLAETEDRIYGPMGAYAGPQIAHLIEAARSDWVIRLLIERTQSDSVLPKVRRLETV